MSLKLRPQIGGMSPYSPGKPVEEVRRELGLERIVKLASNENPLGPSPKAVAALQAAAAEAHLYPDAAAHDLKAALADRAGVSADRIMVGNGSDELIHYLGLALLQGPETRLLIGDPTFVRYAASGQLADSRIDRVPLTSDWRHDVGAMASALTADTRLVYIANPNNPTGTIVTREEIDLLVKALPAGCLLVLDEAYFEFAEGSADYPNGLDLVQGDLPVCVLRTFSKAFGLAGLRVGWGVAPADLVDAVNRIREPFNVNHLAQRAALAALSDSEHLHQTVKVNADGLAGVWSLAESVGLSVIDSRANFACIDLGRPAEPVFQALLRRGVITRSGHVLGMPNHLRVSIGTPAEMEVFAAEFRAVWQSL
ncbi:MAG: histidinol-phosphate transaminase [Fimbriimonadaceae bacterium]|nr:histidinol-phosphate transaminase [Fimbriimonadaceae bacterium]